MEKKQETMPQDAKSSGDAFTGICTVGVLAPHLDKVLDVDDIAMVIVIDKKKQKHLRINYPTKILASHERDNPWGMDKTGCCWSITCKGSGGDKNRRVKEFFWVWPWCEGDHQPSDEGPC